MGDLQRFGNELVPPLPPELLRAVGGEEAIAAMAAVSVLSYSASCMQVVASHLPEGSCRASSSALKLLRASCRQCFDSTCLLRDELVQLAWEVWQTVEGPSVQICTSAVLASAVVLLHLFPDFAQLQSAHIEELTYRSSWLFEEFRPFPFQPEFLLLYQHFRPAGLEGECSPESAKWSPNNELVPGALAEPPRRRTLLVPFADAEKAHCAVVLQTTHLVQRCLSRRFRSFAVAPESGSVPGPSVGRGKPLAAAWHCPKNKTQLAELKEQKYDTQPWRSCSSGHGSTGKPIADSLLCVALVVGEALHVRPGSTVLEWGSGCGWMLTWLHTLYGAEAFAIDASAPAVAWAERFSAGRHCLWGSTDLQWVPEAAFDHVISFWALYHLSVSQQCSVIRQLVRKLKTGGRAWFGGNTPWGIFRGRKFSQVLWLRCLRGLATASGLSFTVDFVHDLALFRDGHRKFTEVPGDFMFLAPSYSAFVMRTA